MSLTPVLFADSEPAPINPLKEEFNKLEECHPTVAMVALYRLHERLRQELYNRPLQGDDSTFCLSNRAVNVLLRLNVCTIGELVQVKEIDLINVKYCGSKIIEEIRTVLKDIGFDFKKEG